MKLSIGMMVKNESKHLEKCLESLKPIMNKVKSELIIIDTGSEDNTVEIAKKYTDKVYYHKWNNNFSEIRNMTVKYSKGEWFFFIDGDEILENPGEMIHFLNSNICNKYNSACVLLKNIMQDKDDASYAVTMILRLFKKDKDFRFKGAVHEQPQYKNPIYALNTTLVHYGYISTDKVLMERKFRRNTEILKSELNKEPDNIYIWYQISASYGMYKNYEKALEYALKAYEIAKKKNMTLHNRMYIYTHLMMMYYANEKYDKVEEICREALSVKDGYIDLYFYMASAQKMLMKNEEAIRSYYKYLSLLDLYRKKQLDTIKDNAVAHYSLDKANYAFGDLCVLYERTANYEKILEYAKKIDDINVLSSVFYQIISAYLKLNSIHDLKIYYDEKVSRRDDKSIIHKFEETLENYMKNLDLEEQIRIIMEFSTGSTAYSLLNKIRINLKEDIFEINEDMLKNISEIDYNEIPPFYGDIIYYLIKAKIPLEKIIQKVSENKLMQFLGHCYKKHEGFIKTIVEYLENIKVISNNLIQVRISKEIDKFLLLSEELDEVQYKQIFRRYLNDGIFYISKLYNKEIIEKEMVCDVKNEEHTFLMYIYLANNIKVRDKRSYIGYLRKALNAYPFMKKGIQILLDELQENENIENESLQQYQTKVKEHIIHYINCGELNKAKTLIDEYERIIKTDADIYSMKAVLAMMENRLEDAEKALEEGLKINHRNCDLLYNKAYLYKLRGQIEKAVEIYNKILETTDDVELKKEIEEELSSFLCEKHSPDSNYIVTKMEQQGIVGKELSDNWNSKNSSMNKDTFNEESVSITNVEMEDYKRQFKSNIESLIEQNLLQEAKELIKEYEDIVKDDIDIYSIKGVIAIMEGDMDEAEEILGAGYKIDNNNSDILYNMACLYFNNGQFGLANHLFKRLYNRTNDINLKKEIEKTVGVSIKSCKNKVLIGSPIYQKPQILREFLRSLEELEKDVMKVDYYFIDDNKIEESSDLLKHFAEKLKNVFIYKTQNEDDYRCDNHTHHWKENLVWKVAKFKDMIIKYAKRNDYDYVFFVDSDIVLHPNTLKHLLSTGKDIISEIFWTKWEPNLPELPQVWLMDAYTQYNTRRGEQLTKNEITNRRQAFINQLKIPGIYKVGGLGACTLISKYAIEKGVNFKEIENLSFWGEDRHFCIRAKALGLDLYVDTHYPAYHIYRESDLAGVNDYKKRATSKVITLVNTNYSGSNNIAMYKLIPEKIKDKYYVELVNQDNSYSFFYKIITSNVVITTEGNYHFNKELFNRKQLVIDLWHGFPIKSMGYVDKGEKFKDNIEKIWTNIDYIASYSKLFNEIMNQCIQVEKNKYKILGAPRNDFLFVTNGRENLSNLLQIDLINKNIVLYVPTYRYTARGNREDGNRKWNNYFGFESFDNKGFSQFLQMNNIVLILKLHPAEEHIVIDSLKESKNIRIITNNMLFEKQLDLYEVLNGCDVLITDYSSIYFDFLLLDRPIIFTPVDLIEYRKNRGFLLEPYEDWTPGPKCLRQVELEKEIINCLANTNYYQDKRKIVLDKVHEFKDGFSTKRTWEFIDNCLSSM
ncbi:MAG: CDP-glycerol glycerophosphotransferase family protein [Firmicutes bacterium]|nr:CDP-glycerol glycerophosphotransferase family protein [Bacillota bacterium]